MVVSAHHIIRARTNCLFGYQRILRRVGSQDRLTSRRLTKHTVICCNKAVPSELWQATAEVQALHERQRAFADMT